MSVAAEEMKYELAAKFRDMRKTVLALSGTAEDGDEP
jgi:hypothetical protein